MSPSYGTFIGGFIAFLALTLLALLDVRRGFLFHAYTVRTLFYVFTPFHVLMLTSGLVGMIACYWGATSREPRLSDTSRYVKGLTVIIFALLVVDLFAYRSVPAARSLASGRINADWLQAFGVIGWRRPIAQATSYLLNVWHATMLGILISGLMLSILPMYLKPVLDARRLHWLAVRGDVRATAAVLLVLLISHGALIRATRRVHELPALVRHRRTHAERHNGCPFPRASASTVRHHTHRCRILRHDRGDLHGRAHCGRVGSSPGRDGGNCAGDWQTTAHSLPPDCRPREKNRQIRLLTRQTLPCHQAPDRPERAPHDRRRT